MNKKNNPFAQSTGDRNDESDDEDWDVVGVVPCKDIGRLCILIFIHVYIYIL
jgi:hypothetical protein